MPNRKLTLKIKDCDYRIFDSEGKNYGSTTPPPLDHGSLITLYVDILNIREPPMHTDLVVSSSPPLRKDVRDTLEIITNIYNRMADYYNTIEDAVKF